jgi:hypothetical protein
MKTRGYWTATTKAELRALGFGTTQLHVPALVLPVFNVAGEIALYQARPDHPRIKDGKPVKYETVSGSRIVLDCHPIARSQLGNPRVPLFITEGIKKGDALVSHGCSALALLGVWNWRGSNEHGGKMALPDWESIALNGRTVYVVFDSDVMVKRQVHAALIRLKGFLQARGAQILLIYLPSGPHGCKVGIDDYLAAGHKVEEALQLARPELPEFADEEPDSSKPYEETAEGLIWLRSLRDGGVHHVPLTNFLARIVADIVEDDGVQMARRLELEASQAGHHIRFSIPAGQFQTMNWPMEYVGPQAIVYPGQAIRDHSRCAIQTLSTDIQRRHVFSHTGWTNIDGRAVYLHADGTIGPDGPVREMYIDLPTELRRYRLPEPPCSETTLAAVKASLKMLLLGPDGIVFPVYAAIWTAALGESDFTLYLTGRTGVFKTELAACAQQHYGPEMDSRHLPASWSSTANALQTLTFHAKDALLVVDDFSPGGSRVDVDRLHHHADLLLRAQGNQAGRQRLSPDARPRVAKPPHEPFS